MKTLKIFFSAFIVKIISVAQKNYFEAIKNDGKSNRVLRAWTEIFYKVLLTEKCKQFTEVYVMWIEKHVLVKKMYTNGLKKDLVLRNKAK